MKLGIDARNVNNKSSGIINYIENLIKELSGQGDFELYIFHQKKYASQFTYLNTFKKVKLIPVYSSDKFLDIRDLIYENVYFFHKINKLQLDLFHNPFGYGIPFFLKIPAILTIHDLIPFFNHDELSFLQKKIYKYSLNISVKKSVRIVTISEFTKNEFLKFYPSFPAELIDVIYNGSDDLSSYEKIDENFIFLKDKFKLNDYILYIGSGTKRKNLIRLSKAFIELKKTYKIPHKLVLVSKFNRPRTKKTLHSIISLLEKNNLTEYVVFPGYINNLEKASLLKHCNLFVFPSLYEGFGLPILEALNFNKAVACSDIPPFHEISGDKVAYFDPKNIDSMTTIIAKIISDENYRNSLIQKSNEKQDFFSWKRMAEQYCEAYHLIIK